MASDLSAERKQGLVSDALRAFVDAAQEQSTGVPEERQQKLQVLLDYIRSRKTAPTALNFICTHNSRRSHFGQVGAQLMAWLHGLDYIRTYSGGTETTAMNPRSVAALERAGYRVDNPGGENPRYGVRFAEEAPVMTCFSKVYDDPANPADDFAAVMTCTDADQNCPAIVGATRISLPCVDPKAFDDTEQEQAKYSERCLQIAAEMAWVMSRV